MVSTFSIHDVVLPLIAFNPLQINVPSPGTPVAKDH